MFISAKKQFIFIHIPKTGGTSISSQLRLYCDILNQEDRRHAPLFCAFDYITADQFESFRKIAVVRNPWEWLLSNYIMVLKSPATPYYRQAIEMGFHRYVRFHIEENIFPLCNYLFLPDRDDTIVPDRLLRFERLEEDYKALCEELQIDSTLGHEQERSNDIHYSAFYDEETKDYVAQKLKKEIDLLGYGFDRVIPYGDVDTQAVFADLVNAHAAWNLGMEELAQQKWKKAERLFLQAIEIKKDEPKFHRQISHAYAMQREWNKAVAAATTAIKLNPKNSDYHLHRDNVLEMMKNCAREPRFLPQRIFAGLRKMAAAIEKRRSRLARRFFSWRR